MMNYRLTEDANKMIDDVFEIINKYNNNQWNMSTEQRKSTYELVAEQCILKVFDMMNNDKDATLYMNTMIENMIEIFKKNYPHATLIVNLKKTM
jgi:hypothetical protein